MQNSFRAGGPGEELGERAVHPVQDRGAKQEPTHLGGLTLEDFGEEVVGDGALAARELGHEPLGFRMAGQR